MMLMTCQPDVAFQGNSHYAWTNEHVCRIVGVLYAGQEQLGCDHVWKLSSELEVLMVITMMLQY